MKTIKMYSASAQSDSGDNDKGTPSNPYTQEEFDSMLAAGTWSGGYVEGMGYVAPETTIHGSSGSFSDSDSDSWSDPWGSTSDPWGSSEENKSDKPSGSGGGGTSGGQNNTDSSQSDVLPASAFRGYLSSDPTGCLNRCREMLAAAKCQLNNKEIAMTYFDNNGRATIATDDFIYGLNYIDGQLQQNKPVIVAVDYKNGTSMGVTRSDQSGDHFVIIVGGNQTNGYHYYDPATQNKDRGTSTENQFNMSGGLMRSTNKCTGSTHYYILTSIRENK